MISKAKARSLAALQRKKVRETEGRFLVEGLRTCEELLASKYETDILLYCPARLTTDRGRELVEAYRRTNTPVEEVDENSMKKLSGTVSSQGVLAVARIRKFSLSQLESAPAGILLALDQLSEPGNLGTIIRTATWFGIEGILLSKNSVEFTNPKVIRASMGACFHIPIFENVDLLPKLSSMKELGYEVFVADSDGSSVYSEYDFTSRSVLVLGNEAGGVTAELKAEATACLRIPRIGHGDSLNVAVATGVILSQMSKAL